MSGFKSFKSREPVIEADPRKCPANGCPMPASVDTGGGFCCSAHSGADPKNWSRITEGLREHDWLRDFITDLQRNPRLVPNAAWRSYALAFWEASDAFMVPRQAEGRELYLYRLHLELLHRVGARNARPEPLVPIGSTWPKRRGNFTTVIEEVAA